MARLSENRLKRSTIEISDLYRHDEAPFPPGGRFSIFSET
jgi:hypothetical protein